MPTYIIEIDTDVNLAGWELDELRQNVIDFVSPDEGTVTISEVD